MKGREQASAGTLDGVTRGEAYWIGLPQAAHPEIVAWPPAAAIDENR